MPVNRQTILSVAPAASSFVDELLAQMPEVGINSPLRAAHFLGQIFVESGGFKVTTESLNYSVTGLLKTFSRARISEADARKYGRTHTQAANQQAIANTVYGGPWGLRNLGNTQPNDGWFYRGRGLKQLTGRDNYTRFAKHPRGRPIYRTEPERVATGEGAVASAIWFWDTRMLNGVADRNDAVAVTRLVNGGTNGLAMRQLWTARFLLAFR